MCGHRGSRDAAQQGHEPVEALELRMIHDVSIVSNVRLAGYAHCSADLIGR